MCKIDDKCWPINLTTTDFMCSTQESYLFLTKVAVGLHNLKRKLLENKGGSRRVSTIGLRVL